MSRYIGRRKSPTIGSAGAHCRSSNTLIGSSLGRLVVPEGGVSRTGFGGEDFKASGQLRLIPSILFPL